MSRNYAYDLGTNMDFDLNGKLDELLRALFSNSADENDVIGRIHKAIRKYAKKESIMVWPCFGLTSKQDELNDRSIPGDKNPHYTLSNNAFVLSERENINEDIESFEDNSEALFISESNESNVIQDINGVSHDSPCKTGSSEKIQTLASYKTFVTIDDIIIENHSSIDDNNKCNKSEPIDSPTKSSKQRQKYKCAICCSKHDDLKLYLKHISIHEGVEQSCRKCKKSFKNKTHFEMHSLLGECRIKAEGFKGLWHIFDEMLSINVDVLKECIVCPHCGLRFKKAFNLQQHLKKSQSCKPETKQFKLKCIHRCKLTFCHKEELNKHLKTIHAHLCKICRKEFPTIKQLNSHLPTHKRIYKCEHCSDEFTKRELLRDHKRNNHKIVKKEKVTHLCPYCKKLFTRKFLMQRHIYKEHPHNESPPVFACDKCPTLLKTQGSFNDHVRIHEEKNSYFCNICSKGFKVKTQLKRHLLKHSNTKAFECDQCRLKLKRKDHLRRHVRTMHQGLKITAESKTKKHPKLPSNEPPPQEEQFFSLIDVQSGEMFSVPATDYTYNLIFKQQNKLNTPLIGNTEPIPWSGSTAIFNQSETTPASNQYTYLQEKESYPLYATAADNLNLMPTEYQQNIIEPNYAESSSNIVVITNVSDLLCMPEVVSNNGI